MYRIGEPSGNCFLHEPESSLSRVHELWVLPLTLQYKVDKLQPDDWYMYILTKREALRHVQKVSIRKSQKLSDCTLLLLSEMTIVVPYMRVCCLSNIKLLTLDKYLCVANASQ